MLPLAATSSNAAIRRLGGQRWQNLHRTVYGVAILGVAHYLWQVKKVALLDPLIYTAILVLLLGWRMKERLRLNGPWPTRSTTPAVHPIIFMKRGSSPSRARKH